MIGKAAANTSVRGVRLWRLEIPLRQRVSHAARERRVSEPIVCAVELNAGAIGWGEALPREYVTGESVDSVWSAVERVFCPAMLRFCPERFANALELVDGLPWEGAEGRLAPAARGMVEMALLDAYSRHFRKPLGEIPGWMGLVGFGAPGSVGRVRHGGVLATASFAKMKKHARLYWWYGLQDFKLKVGLADDDARVRWLARYLGSALGAGGATLRLDANGAWSLDEAIYRLSRWKDIPIAAVEQPLAKGDEQALGELRASVRPTIYLDESLVTLADGKSLVETGGVGGFNIRLSKCGGLMASLRLAALARRNGVGIQLGCMVGETSILSAAGRRFLELVPDVRFVEGSFGGLLMRDDIVRRSLRFGFGGRVQALPGYGWGVDAGSERLDALSKKRGEFVL